MSAKLGNVNKFYIKVGSATTYSWLTGEQNNNVNRTQEAIEVSDKSSSWAQFIAGKKGATIEATIFADNSDTQQQELLKSLHNGSDVPFFVGQLSTDTPAAPSDGEVGNAVITAISDTNDFGAVSTRTVSLTVNGALTHYPAFTQSQAAATNPE